MKRDGGVGCFASRMAGSLPSIPDSEKKTNNTKNNQVNFIPETTSNDATSGTDIIKGLKDFYNLADKSGLLNEEKVNETKQNLLNIAGENKNNKSGSNGDTGSNTDSKLISYNFQGLDPRKDIFNYNPQGNVGFDVGNKDKGFFATGDVDVSMSGLNTNLQAGFKNENFDVSINPERGLQYDFNKKFKDKNNLNINQQGVEFDRQLDDKTNLSINQSGAGFRTNLGDNTNVNLAYYNSNFSPSLTTNIKDTDININQDRFNLNKTFEIGDNARVNLSGEVGFNGKNKANIDFTKDFLNKKLQLYGGAGTDGNFEVGTKFKFLNL